MLIYFAAPLFNSAEKQFNLQLTEKLEALGYRVFLPQRDGIEQEEQDTVDAAAKARLQRKIFELDSSKVYESDVFLFILDGRVPDEGACVELGLAHADKILRKQNRLLIGLHTDVRAAFPEAKLNPMLRIPLDVLVETEGEVVRVLAAYKKGEAIDGLTD